MRTNEEIFQRINDKESMDLFGVQKGDLFSLLTFEQAKPYLSPSYITMIENDQAPEDEKWLTVVPSESIREFMDFAYSTARRGKALMAQRCLLHYRTWVWYDDPEFYETIANELLTCDDYGVEVLKKIISRYNIELGPYIAPATIEVKPSPDEES